MTTNPTDTEAKQWIQHLGLQPHPEGGWYAETYRSDEMIPAAGLPARYGSDRAYGTAIYFMLTRDSASRMHRLQSDEIWNFYSGSAITLHVFDATTRELSQHILHAAEPGGAAYPQYVMRRGLWFGATVDGPYALVGATVCPGFDFRDFELAEDPGIIGLMRSHGVDARVLPPGGS